MKRSEIVENIKQLTKMLLGVENDIFASYLLSDLEAKGMLPPGFRVKVEIERHPFDLNKPNDEYEWRHDWEPNE